MVESVLAVLDLVMLLALSLSLPVAATVHILYTKDDVSAAMAWLGMCWFVPIFGVLLYLLFGINRIRRRAKAVRARQGLKPKLKKGEDTENPDPINEKSLTSQLKNFIPTAPRRWQAHAVLAERISRNRLSAGNSQTLLPSGEAAIAAMVEAIDQAEKSIALTSYIFQADQAGRRFIKALERAKQRGVDIRVLVDAVGNWYGFRPVLGLLKRRGIQGASFNPPSLTWRLAFFNLRTHRKMLIIDGQHGFAGGVNIRRHYLRNLQGRFEVQDTHFSMTGPVVAQMMDIFADDWFFVTGEELSGSPWYRDKPVEETNTEGGVMRAVSDGPDESTPVIMNLLEGALYAARERVAIVTPYFIPEASLVQALQQAALRGVQVDVIVPKVSNLPLFTMASGSGFSRLLECGVRIFLSPAPFDHSKLFLVDDDYAVIGSSNWDARSLRLNFEFNMEFYGADMIADVGAHIVAKQAVSTLLTLQSHRDRPLWRRALGRVLWLFSPYL